MHWGLIYLLASPGVHGYTLRQPNTSALHSPQRTSNTKRNGILISKVASGRIWVRCTLRLRRHLIRPSQRTSYIQNLIVFSSLSSFSRPYMCSFQGQPPVNSTISPLGSTRVRTFRASFTIEYAGSQHCKIGNSSVMPVTTTGDGN